MGDGENPNHTYEEPGVYLVCLTITDASGCVDDVCHEVVVEDVSNDCEAGFTWAQVPGGYTIQFTNTSTSNHDIISYVWTFGDGHMGDGENPSHTYEEPGGYLVCLTITDNAGCVDDVCHEVIVVPGEPMGASFGYSIGAGGLSVHFHNQSNGANEQTQWTWDFGDGTGSTEASPTHHYTAAGSYTVCLTMFDPSTFFSDVACQRVMYLSNGTQFDSGFRPVYGTNPAKDQAAFADEDIELRYTNPSDERLDVHVRASGHQRVLMSLHDTSGRRVAFAASDRITSGTLSLSMPISGLAPGMYVLRVQTDGMQAVRMVMIVH
jgi:plastocyanin